MADDLFQISDISAGYGTGLALDQFDLIVPGGCVVAFCGPNGSGKSTALRIMRNLLKPRTGDTVFKATPVSEWDNTLLARAMALLPQMPSAASDLTVRELAFLGRFSHKSALSRKAKSDLEACETALKATGLLALSEKPIGQLSGGQRQKAWIAMVLAQEAGTILLDEPTNHLDMAHTIEVLELVRRLNREEGRNIVVVLHDLNMVARFADHVVLFDKGKVAVQGSVDAVLTPEILSDVFEIETRVIRTEGLDHALVVPMCTTGEQ